PPVRLPACPPPPPLARRPLAVPLARLETPPPRPAPRRTPGLAPAPPDPRPGRLARSLPRLRPHRRRIANAQTAAILQIAPRRRIQRATCSGFSRRVTRHLPAGTRSPHP